MARLLGYLKLTCLQPGLLMNFGSYKFQIKKYIRTDQPTIVPSLGRGALLPGILVFFAFFCGSPGSSMQFGYG
ncbi:MAG TPA: hypothetical protein VKY92_04445 [Verrucomicrobiae bacterium]|nr:hypothetical protein [Verrucomicrobiae bacterium]